MSNLSRLACSFVTQVPLIFPRMLIPAILLYSSLLFFWTLSKSSLPRTFHGLQSGTLMASNEFSVKVKKYVSVPEEEVRVSCPCATVALREPSAHIALMV